MLTNAFVPMKEAVAVSSGYKINSSGAPIASALAVIILCRPGLSTDVKSRRASNARKQNVKVNVYM